MNLTDSRSSADAAFSTFEKVRADGRIFQLEEKALSEADTRVKLIDPVFRDVLGWSEAEIRREAAVTKGYIDYVLGSEYSYLLVEAKRAAPRFQLSVTGKPRRLKLSGPHLLGNKKIKPHLEQAQGYANDLGVQFCIVTNGTQFIVFKPYLPGRSWRLGEAIAFHDHGDIQQHFAEFYQLFARDNVVAGSLIEAFEQFERTTAQLYTVLSQLSDPDRELLRNQVWGKIAKIMAPLLTDSTEDRAAQLEVINNCYVTTRLGDQTDSSLDSLIRDLPQKYLTDANVVDLQAGAKGKTALSHRMEADVKAARPGAYVLTGGVGSGKTTFMTRFAHITERDLIRNYAVWVSIDFLPIGNVDASQIDLELRKFAYQRIRAALVSEYSESLISTGEQVREMFADEINEARLTRLHGLDENESEWTAAVNIIVDGLFNNDERFVTAAVRVLARRGRRIVIVLDNTDQQGEAFQTKVFLLSQKLSADFGALCVVALREEKFFAAFRRGIFNAYGDRRFHIGSPHLKLVLAKRLEYGRKKFAGLAAEGTDALASDDLAQIDALLHALIQSTTHKNANIVRMLASVSNGNMRYALDMFREFLSSGNTNVEKIIHIVNREGGYIVPFHEFAKSAILGSRKYYKSSVSHAVNVFKQSDALGASHMTACRILARLSAAEGAASPHGEGFVSVADLQREFRTSFGYADDLVQWVGELLRRNLIESEPPRVAALSSADALRINASGAYYWRYLVRSFAYMDLVFVDTPIADAAVVRKLATMADLTDMTVRYERVRLFIDYLQRKEADEISISAERSGPFQEPLAKQIREQVEKEIRLISKKTGVKDEFGPA